MEKIFELINKITDKQELFCIQHNIETKENIYAVIDLHKDDIIPYLESLEGFEFIDCKLQDKVEQEGAAKI